MHDALRKYITGEIMRSPKYPLANDEPLMTGGLIDSFSLVQIGLFIEDTFGVKIPDVELTVENMDTLDKMVANIQRKQA